MRRSSSCLMFARIASCLMNRSKSSRISFSLIVIWIFFGLIVAVAGIEPATFLWYEWHRFILGTLTTMTTKTLYQLSYTADHVLYIC